MPNRILKESICTSEEIDCLTEQQEVFFYRLMVACDDYGLMDARPAILKARCYPLKSIDCKRIQIMLDELNRVGLIGLYTSEGRPYLHITNWEKHQSIRAKKPKYPYPQADDFICKQMQANVPVIQSNPIQSESNPIQSSAESKPATATRLPADWYPSTDDQDFCQTSRPDLNTQEVADGFRDYWISQPGAKGKKLDWSATWRNWVRNQRAERKSAADKRSDTVAYLTGRAPLQFPTEKLIQGEVING
jgi:hypothetical protein